MTLSSHQAIALLSAAVANPAIDLVREGREIHLVNKGDLIAIIKTPPILVLTEELELRLPRRLLCVLIRTGQAAITLYDEEEVEDSSVIRKYMVRKSQGKSQLSFAKTRGKSRLGSRIRLRNAVSFFDEITEKLDHLPLPEVDHILFSCAKTLLPHFWERDQPFAKTDSRLIKVPHHVHPPTLSEVERIVRLCHRGELVQVVNDHPLLETLLATAHR